MSEIVVIGSTEFLPGFALAGVRKTILANAATVMEKITQNSTAGIILLDESITTELTPMQREHIDTSITPIIIALTKDAHMQNERLKRAIMNTLGVDLLK
jgi:vacuolar-type H+-ATPase subunit F/Vma7